MNFKTERGLCMFHMIMGRVREIMQLLKYLFIEVVNKLTGPKEFESMLEAGLSPSTQQCPSGILKTSEE